MTWKVVVDHHYPGEVIDGKVAVDDYVDVHVNPYLEGGDSQVTAGALAVELAQMINPEVKGPPFTSAWNCSSGGSCQFT